MSVKTGTVTLKWADDEYPFRLAKREMQELSRKVIKLLMIEHGVSEAVAVPLAFPFEIYSRIARANPIAGEVREIIFQGLVGADMKPQEANALCRRYVDERPLLESIPVAQSMMLVGLMGPPDAGAKKNKPAQQDKASPSASDESQKTAPHLASVRAK